MIPMIPQTMKAIQVSLRTKYIKNKLKATPKDPTKYTAGVLYGLSNSGFLTLKIITATHTMAKANKVPIEHISLTLLMGVKAATIEMIPPTNMVLLCGVLKVGCKVLKKLGNKPSLAIPKKILVCPNIITNITLVNPAVAARVMMNTAQVIPFSLKAEATGADLSNWS